MEDPGWFDTHYKAIEKGEIEVDVTIGTEVGTQQPVIQKQKRIQYDIFDKKEYEALK